MRDIEQGCKIEWGYSGRKVIGRNSMAFWAYEEEFKNLWKTLKEKIRWSHKACGFQISLGFEFGPTIYKLRGPGQFS